MNEDELRAEIQRLHKERESLFKRLSRINKGIHDLRDEESEIHKRLDHNQARIDANLEKLPD